ncbi:hypothetical protein [Mycobacteroides abscessus]|uniref:hypothetical protein n=1 Tax=Mycobacteroides abscessus TaxID=36809 RepID=UPI001A96F0FD|nr:hypothetical protein [Mycobacteroides abscessus]
MTKYRRRVFTDAKASTSYRRVEGLGTAPATWRRSSSATTFEVIEVLELSEVCPGVHAVTVRINSPSAKHGQGVGVFFCPGWIRVGGVRVGGCHGGCQVLIVGVLSEDSDLRHARQDALDECRWPTRESRIWVGSLLTACGS